MPGNPSQIKHCAKELTNITKALGITSIIVGHVTKRNDIAGPKALEHIIDCTWFMDRNPIDDTIVARTMKNRFGPTDKVAMLRMTPQGLDEVSDVELREMYQDRTIAIVEQSGELMGCELQCSIRRTSMPRHNILGYDVKRFRAILSIIKKHTGLTFESHEINLDVYPTLESNKEVELSLACAIISCYLGLNRRNVCYIGELLMDGSIRPVEHANILKDYANRIGKEGRDQYAHLQELIDEEFVKYIT
jgi:DNA repair protein RadA/Sms